MFSLRRKYDHCGHGQDARHLGVVEKSEEPSYRERRKHERLDRGGQERGGRPFPLLKAQKLGQHDGKGQQCEGCGEPQHWQCTFEHEYTLQDHAH